MKTQIICTTLMAIGLVTGCQRSDNMGGTGNASDSTVALNREERHVGPKLNELPAAVQATIKEQAPNGTVADIDKQTRSGQVVYDVSFKDKGVNPSIKVAADGTLVKSDLGKADNANLLPADSAAVPTGNGKGPIIGTTMKDLPVAVRQTIMEKAPNAEVTDIDKKTRDGRVTYEVTFKDTGKNPKMLLNEDGSVAEDLHK
ncbi:MAG: hypothetical protein JWQ71_195 [Pedosphaera sp.]|nr:hypothetical protein [Pedosphaera sp.]